MPGQHAARHAEARKALRNGGEIRDFLRTSLCRRLALLTIAVLAVGGIVEYRILLSEEKERALANMREASALAQSDVDAFIAHGEESAKFLVQVPPVEGLIRALAGEGYDAQEDSTADLWTRRLEQIFTVYLRTNPDAYELRYIRYAEGGRELVRVSRNENGIIATPEHALQKKGHRDYVRAATQTETGEVYISALNLDREHGKIQIPRRPTIRLVAPVYDGQGERFGLVVLNLDASRLLANIKARWDNAPVYVTDHAGRFLSHPNKAKAFAHEFGDGNSFRQEFQPTSSDQSARTSLLETGEPQVLRHAETGREFLFRRQALATFAGGEQELFVSVASPFEAMQVRGAARTVAILGIWGAITGVLWIVLFLYWTSAQQRMRRLQEENRLAAIVSSASDTIVSLDSEGRVQSWNSAAESLTDHQEREAIGRPFHELIGAKEERQSLSPGGHNESWVRKNGQPVEVSVTTSELLGPAGELLGFALVARDITKEREYQKAIERQNTDLEQVIAERTAQLVKTTVIHRAIMTSAGYAIIAVNHKGDIQLFNPAAEQMLGYRHEDVQEKENLRLLDAQTSPDGSSDSEAQTQPLDWQALQSQLQTGAVVEKSGTMNTRSGKRLPVRIRMTALRDDENAHMGALIIANDETERLLRDKDLMDAREEAVKGNKAKSQFLANMSHEIRTPMNAVQGMLQLLERTELKPTQRHYAAEARVASQTLLDILNDILDYSKIEAGKMRLSCAPFRLEHVLREVGTILSSSLQDKDVELVYVIAPETPRNVGGDALRLKQVLLNLTSNAIKFTEQGEVVLRIEVDESTQSKVRLDFSVSDTGIGMTEEHLGRVFEGFEQADGEITRRYEGTGLGLPISRHLVELMGGELVAESQMGEGSTFRFSIELTNVDQVPPSVPTATTDGRMLVLEPNDKVLEMLRTDVEASGWEVHGGGSVDQVLADLNASPFDVALLDRDALSSLPQVALRRLGSALEEVPVVILERYADPEHPIGLTWCCRLQKPVTHSVLHDAIAQALTQQADTFTNTTAPVKKRLRGLCILVVEDVPVNQRVAQTLLESEGARVIVAGGGEIALKILNRKPESFDVILMDIQMPNMDGLETTRLLHETIPKAQAPVIAMTAHAMAEDRATCLAAGMVDHIGKPFQIDELVATIASNVGEKRAAG